MRRMRRQVMEHNIYRWAANVLGDLRELRLEGGEGIEIHRAAPVSEHALHVADQKRA
jgi:trehalose-6-phosphate synthase